MFDKKIVIKYTNHRNETSLRNIIPKRIWFGKTDYHPEEQWLLEAYDCDKQADRNFAIKDILSWSQ